LVGVGLEDGVEGPVLDLEDQQAAAGVEDQEVGVAVFGADGDVVADEVVVFEEAAETGGEAALAGGGAGGRGGGRAEEGGHWCILTQALDPVGEVPHSPTRPQERYSQNGQIL